MVRPRIEGIRENNLILKVTKQRIRKISQRRFRTLRRFDPRLHSPNPPRNQPRISVTFLTQNDENEEPSSGGRRGNLAVSTVLPVALLYFRFKAERTSPGFL
jgi:hypothetical protein